MSVYLSLCSPVSLTCLSLTCLSHLCVCSRLSHLCVSYLSVSYLCVQERAAGLEPPPLDRVEDLKRKTDGVIETLAQNIKILVDRQENLEELEMDCKELKKEVTVTASSVNKV